jgi:hypothetical protein
MQQIYKIIKDDDLSAYIEFIKNRTHLKHLIYTEALKISVQMQAETIFNYILDNNLISIEVEPNLFTKLVTKTYQNDMFTFTDKLIETHQVNLNTEDYEFLYLLLDNNDTVFLEKVFKQINKEEFKKHDEKTFYKLNNIFKIKNF